MKIFRVVSAQFLLSFPSLFFCVFLIKILSFANNLVFHKQFGMRKHLALCRCSREERKTTQERTEKRFLLLCRGREELEGGKKNSRARKKWGICHGKFIFRFWPAEFSRNERENHFQPRYDTTVPFCQHSSTALNAEFSFFCFLEIKMRTANASSNASDIVNRDMLVEQKRRRRKVTKVSLCK